MSELTIAVVSDLHCHHSSVMPSESLLLTDADRIPSTQHPVQSLLEIIKARGLRADILLMPGDLTNRCDKQGIVSGWAFVNEIADALNVETVAPTLGNHDVNSRQPGTDPFKSIKGLAPSFPSKNDAENDTFWAKGYCIKENSFYRVLSINSVMGHINEANAIRGRVTNQQLEQMAEVLSGLAPMEYQIAVCHHHPLPHEDIGLGADDLMENGSLLLSMLSERKFDLIVHGHKHHPKLSIAPDGILPVLAAGSFSAGMRNGLASRTRNVFHIIHLRRPQDGSVVQGRILTWQFRQSKGWTPASSDAADFPYKMGFGSSKSFDSIVGEISKAFEAFGRSYVRWESIVEKVPDLNYVPPSHLETILNRLQKDGFVLAPVPPQEPQFIERPA